MKKAKEAGAFDAVICQHWAKGGAGAANLAEAVNRATSQPTNFKFLYDLEVGLILCYKPFDDVFHVGWFLCVDFAIFNDSLKSS